MPIGTRRNQDGINVRTSKQFANVAIHHAIVVAIFSIGFILDRLTPLGFDITNRHEPNIRLLKETAEDIGSTIANSDGRQGNAIARSHPSVFAKHGTGDDLRCRHERSRLGRAGKECTAIEQRLMSLIWEASWSRRSATQV